MAWLGRSELPPRKACWPAVASGWFISIALLAVVLPTPAAEPVLARVLAIAGDRVTLIVQDQTPAASAPFSIAIDQAALPLDLAPGALVRLWPGATPDVAGFSAGARLAPLERGGALLDRTGVRARLMRGAERGLPGRRGGR